jgi:hypothetical protein
MELGAKGAFFWRDFCHSAHLRYGFAGVAELVDAQDLKS